ncbi:MAG: hypothetical protein AB1430_09430 [Pseudomonadota bacterium]
MKRLAWAALALLWAQGAVAADTVYRCGPVGQTYSAEPCTDGKPLRVDDGRTAAQQRQARAMARREAALAEQMARDRRKREKAAPKGATRIGPAEASASAASAADRAIKQKRKKSGAGTAAPRDSAR